MEDHGKSDGWDEVLEEDDELARCKYHISTSFLSSGTSRRSKSVNKPRFSLRGYDFIPLDVKTDNLCTGGQEGTSAVPSTKASQTVVAARLENIDEQTEDLEPEFALPTKKANTSVSELLDNLQRRSGSSVRAPSSLHQHAPCIAIKEHEVSSGVPPTKASQALMAEPFGNVKEQTEDLPLEFPRKTKKANLSVAELLEDLQGRSDSYVETASLSHQRTKAKHWKPKLLGSEKKALAILGDRSIDSEDPLEPVLDGTSSEEDATENHLTLVHKDENQQTMADLFQEVFNPKNMEGDMISMRSTGAGKYGRMQKIMQMEKDKHAEFLRQYNREQGYSGDLKGTTVQIMSRSLEGKLTVCSCMFQEKSNNTAINNASADSTLDELRTRRTIIFSPKICDSADLLVGNLIHIFPPWKVVQIQEEQVIICTYFSHHQT